MQFHECEFSINILCIQDVGALYPHSTNARNAPNVFPIITSVHAQCSSILQNLITPFWNVVQKNSSGNRIGDLAFLMRKVTFICISIETTPFRISRTI